MHNGIMNCQEVNTSRVPLERCADLASMANWPEWLWVCDRLPLSTGMEEDSSDTVAEGRFDKGKLSPGSLPAPRRVPGHSSPGK